VTVTDPVPLEPGLVLVASADGAERCVRLLLPDVDAALPTPAFEARAVATADGATITVTAKSFVRALCVFPDRVDEDAWADSALIDLFAGESHDFNVRGSFTEADLTRLTEAPALRALDPKPTPSEAL
jgi:beta-mannosidase